MRVDTVSRVIAARPGEIYRAMLDPVALAAWLPPENMTARVEQFDPRPGGTYLIVLTYRDAEPGKSGDGSDVTRGRFTELVPDERVVHIVTFDSDDPAFAGEMTMTWTLAGIPDGTEVTFRASGVPAGISAEDHQTGMSSSLANLAAHVE